MNEASVNRHICECDVYTHMIHTCVFCKYWREKSYIYMNAASVSRQVCGVYTYDIYVCVCKGQLTLASFICES